MTTGTEGRNIVCARCGGPFECRADAIELCHCSAVQLTGEELEALKKRYADCLCAACLATVTHSLS